MVTLHWARNTAAKKSVGPSAIGADRRRRRRSTHGSPNFSLQKCFTVLPVGPQKTLFNATDSRPEGAGLGERMAPLGRKPLFFCRLKFGRYEQAGRPTLTRCSQVQPSNANLTGR